MSSIVPIADDSLGSKVRDTVQLRDTIQSRSPASSFNARMTKRLSQWLTYDYFPELDPYIQWLRQPLGWFVFAMVACVLVGMFLSTMAWSLAGGLLALLMMGILYPWLSIRGVQCQLACQLAELAEGETQYVTITVRNRCPWPVCGLIIEGFLVTPEQNDSDVGLPSGDVALGYVPWLSSATYRLPITPQWRGRYPQQRPELTCAFPLAIWTARRVIEQVQPVIVRPSQTLISGLPTAGGSRPHHFGTGQRSGGHGDFLGLRAYQPGDAIRNIHWAHTARTDDLVVCQRGAAQQALWAVVVDGSSSQRSAAARQHLAWRVRVAASLCHWLQGQHLPFELLIHGQPAQESSRALRSQGSYEQALDRLTDLPLDGYASNPNGPAPQAAESRAECYLTIGSVMRDDADGQSVVDLNLIELTLHRRQQHLRNHAQESRALIRLDEDLPLQLTAWLQRSEQGCHAA